MQYVQLIQQLRSLRVPGMVEALEQHLEQPATHNDLSFEQRLNLMIDREVTYRSNNCLLYTSPSPRDKRQSRMPSSA